MLDKLCLVMDIDETMAHYVKSKRINTTFEYARDLFNKDKDEDENDALLLRPGLGEFFEYVKSYSPDNVFRSVSSNPDTADSTPIHDTSNKSDISDLSNISEKNNKSIVIGIWTYGSEDYAHKVKAILELRYGIKFEFVYSREVMKLEYHKRQILGMPAMNEKELDYILNKHGTELGINKENIYLVDNCPSNIYHSKNIKNGILVTSFVGNKIDEKDKMFLELRDVCEDLLHKPRVHKKYINSFTIGGTPTNIISIGKNGDKKWDLDNNCVLSNVPNEYEGGKHTMKKYKYRTRKNKKRIYKTANKRRLR